MEVTSDKAIKTRGVRIITSNTFITAKGLEELSLKARKLLYIAIAQCRMSDNKFSEYFVTVKDFANMMNISPTHVYETADEITNELMRSFLQIKPEGKKKFKKYSLFSSCQYDCGMVKFKLNPDMTDFLLNQTGDFSKPLLEDFMLMKSPYSMAIWHTMQMEMRSKKPTGDKEIHFDISLECLRFITNTQDTFKKVNDFKRFVLDKAIKEIYNNCFVRISYVYIKNGRNIIGFHFTAISPFKITKKSVNGYINEVISLNKIDISK